MNNSFLSSYGLGNLDMGIILIVMSAIILILLILIIINIFSISKLKKKYKIFMMGNNAKSLENEIIGLFEDNKFIKVSIDKNRHNIEELSKNMELAFQKTGIIKYDAFDHIGGQLSFSLALLDKNNNGFILNSVHSAEGCYTYTKKINEGKSDISLGEEEKQALDMAMGI